MNLIEYYLKNITDKEYHYKFLKSITNISNKPNIGRNYYDVYDLDDAIAKFKDVCMPENEKDTSEEYKCLFYVLTYYLNKNYYKIKEFPLVLERPPETPFKFTYEQIRNELINLGKYDGNSVKWDDRRQFVYNLHFIRGNDYYLTEEIDVKFKKISNRSASFNNMTQDEKLMEMANLIENLLNVYGKYLKLDYSNISNDFLNTDIIKAYRKKLQCFRHSNEKTLIERNSYNNKQKEFLIKYGLSILDAIYYTLNKGDK
ncbi:hypothetical protein [Ligilactobacillus ceti]|uniref:Uncharacterized protein n=1 Tax=Ligilactobacillus ceti DSM 22408 TaxID=1122146 RepID=A0A0R2KH34_9LACO|nr:hypothetical protein [Ligilactobacillus ceti]KRN88704.1 hypothetical protein IV53_GL000671 [Ligilactobacillus ceti DSM 22408]